MTAKNRKNITLDERGRTSLAGLATEREYIAYLADDGTITLVPAEQIHASVVSILKRPAGSSAR